MRVLDRYITREFLRLFFLFSIAAPLLFVLGDWTDNLDTYTERAIPPAQIGLSYVYQFPLFILWSLPIAALIATVFTVSNMTRHSEMTAAKAGGISFHRAVLMLPILGIVLTAAGLVLSEVVPGSLRRASQLKEDPLRRHGSRSQFVYRGEDGRVYGVRQLDVDAGRIFGITMEREGDRLSIPTEHAIAREAVWDSAGGWTLKDGYLRIFPPDGGLERSFAFQQLRPLRFRETPEQLLAVPKEPEEMRYAELKRFIEILERSGAEPRELHVDLAQKIAIPVATLIIILFGAPLANSQARGGPAYGIGISLGITIVYLMAFRLTRAAGAAGTLHPELAAWIPNMLFLLAAMVLIARLRT